MTFILNTADFGTVTFTVVGEEAVVTFHTGEADRQCGERMSRSEARDWYRRLR